MHQYLKDPPVQSTQILPFLGVKKGEKSRSSQLQMFPSSPQLIKTAFYAKVRQMVKKKQHECPFSSMNHLFFSILCCGNTQCSLLLPRPAEEHRAVTTADMETRIISL